MKAIVFDEYGDFGVARVEEIDRPVVGDEGVLVRIKAASVNTTDHYAITGKPYVMRLMTGVRRPKNRQLGADLAGVVESVGKNVTRFQPGDEVFGQVDGEVPGKPLLEFASFAEYVCVSPNSVEPKPENLTFVEAAAVPMVALTALQGLRNAGGIQAGQHVLINGASGGIGTFAVQMAKAFGAEVTGVCSSKSVELVESLGADHVIDYTKEDFLQSAHTYDLLFDIVGNRPLLQCRRILAKKGTHVVVGVLGSGGWFGPIPRIMAAPLLSLFVSQGFVSFNEQRNQEDMQLIKRWLDSETIKPVVDRTYSLQETVSALRYFAEGHARGKVLIIP